jgi:uncharacterized protein (DUF885 family)
MLKNRSFAIVLSIVLIISMMAGCVEPQEAEPKQEALAGEAAFDDFTAELFRHYAASDSLTLNYLLVHPEDYGIEKPEPTFGEYGAEAVGEELSYAEEQFEALKKFDYDTLSYEQLLTYDILYEVFTDTDTSRDFLYFGDILSPTIGLQSQLPILFAEYHIYEKGDFDYYIALLEALPDYFGKIVDFEREKKAQGTFMAKVSAENVIKQIERFIETPETNLLIGIFDEKIDAFEGLTDEERAEYKDRNRAAVLNAVIPAYRTLADSLGELNANNERTGGLSAVTGGDAYYEFLVKESTGSEKSVDEIETMVDEAITESIEEIDGIYQSNPEAYEDSASPTYPASEPGGMLDYLKDAIKKDFPPLDGDNYEVKYVDESLEEFSSPAFYLLPPIDDASHNVIYINNGGQGQGASLFPTLAHEGYPGHLYQTVYFRQLDRDPIRSVISFDGYMEGWATYVEHQAYALAGLDKDAAALLSANDLATLCIYAKVDIGVNARGWDREKVKQYLAKFGIEDDAAAGEIYDAMVAEPANYLKYTIGCLEFLELRSEAQEELGAEFNAQEFHKFILETGPASFGILGDKMQMWLVVDRAKAAA